MCYVLVFFNSVPFWLLLWVTLGVFLAKFLLLLVILFPYCLSIQLFCYVLFVPIFCCKIVLFPFRLVVVMSFWILSLLAGWIFFCCFGMSCFSVLFNPVSLSFYLSFFRQRLAVLFILIVALLMSFCPYIFQCLIPVLVFLPVVNLLSMFPVLFLIQVLTFCSWNTDFSSD